MKKVILDTNFILSCIKQKIDFFEDIKFKGLKILIPIQVIKELEFFSESDKKLHFKEDAKIALKILKIKKFEKINLGKGKVDDLIVNFAKENQGIIIATLDQELKNKLQNSKLVIRKKKILEII